jgi:hypothetical protein
MLKNDPDGKRYFTLVLNSKGASIANKHVPLYTNKGLLTRYETLVELAAGIRVPVDALEASMTAYLMSSAIGCASSFTVVCAHK